MVKIKHIDLYFVQFLNVMFLLISTYVFIVIEAPVISFKINKIILVILMIMNLSEGISKKGILSLYTLHLLACCFFIYNSFLFDFVLDDYNLLEITFPVPYAFEEQTGNIFAYCGILNIAFLNLGFNLKHRSQNGDVEIKNTITTSDCNLRRIGIGLMLLFAIPACVKFYMQFMYIRQYGYISVYREDLEILAYPFWTVGSSIFCLAGYLCFLASHPDKKNFLIYSSVFAGINFFGMLRGGRSEFMNLFVFLLYYYYHFYSSSPKISYRLLCAYAAIVLFLGIGINNYRRANENRVVETKSLSQTIVHFLADQTTSRAVPMVVMENDQLEYRKYPFVFSPFFYAVNSMLHPNMGQDEIYLSHWNLLGAISTYHLSPGAYYNGNGLGSSYLAELFDFLRYFGIVAGSVFLGLLIAKLEQSRKNISCFLVPAYFFGIQNIIFMPRAECFWCLVFYMKIFISTAVIAAIYFLPEKFKGSVKSFT